MSNRPSSEKSGHNRQTAASRRVRDAQSGSSGSVIWLAVGLVVFVMLVAAAVAFAVRKPSDESGAPPAGKVDLNWSDVAVNGAPLAAAPDTAGAPDPAVGQAAPGLTGKTFDGTPLTIPASGKPKVVMFVAHWCPHCQKEVPLIAEHLGGKLPGDVDLYAVSTGVKEDRPNFPPGAWLRRENWPVPTMVDSAAGTAGDAFGLSGFPYFVAVGADGKVVDRQSGELTTEQFDALLAKARAGGSGATDTTAPPS
jgi:cytochrome c biogenesis protein CcmG/thiol:disulfide interchange protein DsbE